MNKLIQEQGFYYRSFELGEASVRVVSKNFDNDSEYSVDYLNLGVRTFKHEENKSKAWQWLLWLALGLSTTALLIEGLLDFPIISRVWMGAVLFIAALLILWFKLKQEPAMLHLIGGDEKLEFLANTKADELDSFIKKITKRIKKAYRKQYLKDKSDLPLSEQKERIEWLYDMKMIDGTEKKKLLHDLDAQKTAHKIGFYKR